MWWFLKEFGKQITLHTLLEPAEKLSVGGVVTSTSKFFIDGTDEWPGLARRKFWWRIDYSPEKTRERIVKYNDIFNSCLNEGYISCESWLKDGKTFTAIDPMRGDMYDESRGLAGLVQVVGRKLPRFWDFIVWIITVILAVLAYLYKP